MFDAMTGPLQKVTQSLNLTISAMQQMQSTANRNMNVDRTLAAAKQQIASAEASIRQAIDHSTASQNKFNRSIKDTNRESSELLDNIKGIAGAYLTFSGAQTLLRATIGAAMEQQQTLDAFIARTNDKFLGQAIFDNLTEQALKYGQNVNEALSSGASFMSNTMNPKQLMQLNSLAMRLSKLNPAEGLEGAAFSLKELLSGDYTSIVERFNMGRNMIQNSDALKAGKAGDIEGFIKGMDKLLNQQNLTQKAFEKMLDSPAAKWQRAIQTFQYNLMKSGREALVAFQPFIDTINKTFESGKFQGFFNSLSAGLTMFSQVASTTISFVISNFDLFKNALVAIGGIVAFLGARWMVTWIAANWPIFLIIGAITLLLTVLNEFGISTSQVLGFVAGLFAALYAEIYNGIAVVWNVIWSFAEFLFNIFVDPVYAIKKLFYDLFQDLSGFFAGLVNTFIDGLNWVIQKINDLTDAGISSIQKLNAAAFEMQPPTSDKDVYDFSKYKMKYKDVGESFKSGYDFGNNAVNGLSNSISKLMGPFQVPKNQNIDKVGEVGKIKDKVDISSEDLKTMRELAEMKNIQNFVTLQPQLTFGDTHVRQDGRSIDEIVANISSRLEEEIASSARMVLNV